MLVKTVTGGDRPHAKSGVEGGSSGCGCSGGHGGSGYRCGVDDMPACACVSVGKSGGGGGDG